MGILKDNDEIKIYDDLKGKKVVVKIGIEGYVFVEKIKDKYDFDIVVFDDLV